MNARVHPEATAASLSEGADYELLAQRFRPIFARIAEGAVERERQRELPHEAIAWLKQAGFGAVRVPREHGGAGASLPQLVQLLIELAEADSNITQALRGHFAFVEDRLNAEPGPGRDRWLRRFVEGDLVGCAWTEVGSVRLGEVLTRVSRKDDGRWVVNGSKYYSTGSLFSDWIDLYAQRDDTGADVIAAIRTDQPGVRQSDDWDGFGQRTTASGTVILDNVRVPAEHVIPVHRAFDRPTAAGAVSQFIQAAIDAGIARGILAETVQQVRRHARPWIDANQQHAWEDPYTIQQVGDLRIRVRAAEAVLDLAADAIEAALAAPDEESVAAASIAVAEAKVLTTEAALLAANRLFELAGTRSTLEELNLDRHWRNARTHTLHDPVRWKYHAIGNYQLNGVKPPRHAWL
ncbi:SfnB family sulfur acquisition oxidoreductase [Pseudomonas aeruginosa]|uniref:SfnB family sulfur acquisition oxidoreductase n=1 Tax=Pseudomonas aeruginosa TaxID=287 RepID=UPI001C84C4B7|nr:SfnB family sulfur acquisition oxidoreductase [Pseudomonas aeruginosa]QZD66396.1 SfnB family sulfur acquisition oxidoreductase [Pseudomonas aeruginosa]QZH52639.1 SfnB family sulfur acquisition oxidoreductase [Pseudomonas aeruginosa]